MSKPIVRQTNLFNAALIPKPDSLSIRRISSLLTAIFLVAVAICGSTWGYASLKTSRLQGLESEMGAIRARHGVLIPQAAAKTQDMTRQIEQVDEDLRRARQLLATLGDPSAEGAGQQSVKPGVVLQSLALIDAKSVWLTEVEHDVVASALALRGRATDPNAVAPYIDAIRASRGLRNLTFGKLEIRAEEGGSPLWSFAITAGPASIGVAPAKEPSPGPDTSDQVPQTPTITPAVSR